MDIERIATETRDFDFKRKTIDIKYPNINIILPKWPMQNLQLVHTSRCKHVKFGHPDEIIS